MTTAKQITVLLAEDRAIVRQGLCALLNSDGAFQIVGEAKTGREAVEMTQALRPDVIVMDLARHLAAPHHRQSRALDFSPLKFASICVISGRPSEVFRKSLGPLVLLSLGLRLRLARKSFQSRAPAARCPGPE